MHKLELTDIETATDNDGYIVELSQVEYESEGEMPPKLTALLKDLIDIVAFNGDIGWLLDTAREAEETAATAFDDFTKKQMN